MRYLIILMLVFSTGCGGATLQQLTAFIPQEGENIKARTTGGMFDGTPLLCIQYAKPEADWPRDWQCLNRKTNKVLLTVNKVTFSN
jgi:hypothetical protein